MSRPRTTLGDLSYGGALLVAGVSLAGAALAQGGRFSPWLDLASHFAPFWLMGAVLAAGWAVVALRGRRRAAALAMAALGIVAAGALLAPELARRLPPWAPAAAPYRLRLIQFNTWDQLRDPRAVADWIAGERPDIVTVEEDTGPLRRALIAQGFHYTKGMATTAIFSRPPRAPSPFVVPQADWPRLPEFARASFVAPDGGPPFSVVAVHLTWPSIEAKWAQPAILATLLDRYPRDRLIVAGDFNLTPWSFALRRLDRRVGLQRLDRAIPTWPAERVLGGALMATMAVLPIDHVYAGAAWRTVSVRRGPRLGSDHYPLVVDLALVASPPRAL